MPGGMPSRSIGTPSRKKWAPSIWDTHRISGNGFANPTASSLAPYPKESNPWSSNVSEHTHSSHVWKSENQTPVQDQRCQSGPSAKNSFIPMSEDFRRIMVQINNDCRFQIFISAKFPTPATFACWKIRFKTEVCTC